jgi:Zn finger protein HypA/HybF involved in hydrogenase expression
MEMNKCKSKKCQRELPKDYKHIYCEHCRNKYAKRTKDGIKAVGGAVGSLALLVLTKGKFGSKK